MNITLENYNFKKAMQMLINNKMDPILTDRKFKKYKKNYYAREKEDLIQLISFSINKSQLKAYAYYVPVYIPSDIIWDYGIEITGTTGVNLLSGKYYTTLYESEPIDLGIQFEHYQSSHVANFAKLIQSITEGVIPEMESISSLSEFISILENDEKTIFGRRLGNKRTQTYLNLFTFSVFKCLSGEYSEGKKELLDIKQKIETNGELEFDFESNIHRSIEHLLVALDEINGDTKNKFYERYNEICNQQRKKYKFVN